MDCDAHLSWSGFWTFERGDDRISCRLDWSAYVLRGGCIQNAIDYLLACSLFQGAYTLLESIFNTKTLHKSEPGIKRSLFFPPSASSHEIFSRSSHWSTFSKSHRGFSANCDIDQFFFPQCDHYTLQTSLFGLFLPFSIVETLYCNPFWLSPFSTPSVDSYKKSSSFNAPIDEESGNFFEYPIGLPIGYSDGKDVFDGRVLI